MNDYAIHPDFEKYRNVGAAMPLPLLPAVNAFLTLGFRAAKPLPGVRERRMRIPGRIGLTLLEPEDADAQAPCLVYYHGGAFMLKGSPIHKRLACEYALGARCRVVFVDYRLAPKHPYPAGAEDCYTAYAWVRDNAEALGVDRRRIAVGGDSAGGALAAGVCLMARDRGIAPPCFQMLIYPVTDARQQTESMRRFTDTPLWNATANKRMWPLYLREGAPDGGKYASPAEAASLAGLPDAYVETAEYDCLRDEGAAYAQALRGAGVRAELNQTEGTVHGFEIAARSAIVREAVARRAAALIEAFRL